MAKTRSIQTDNLFSSLQHETEVLLQVTPSIMVIFEIGGGILIANDAAARFLGRTVTSILGKNIYELFKFEDAYLQTYAMQLAQSLKEVSFEKTSNGRNFFCVLSPMLSEGNIIRVVLSAQDITERRHTEEQLRTLTQEVENKVHERTNELQKANQKLLQEKQRAELLANFSRVLIEYTSDLSGLFQQISDEITKLITDGWCIIALFSDDHTHLKMVAISHNNSQAVDKIRALVANKVFSLQNVDLDALWKTQKRSISRILSYDRAGQILPPELFHLFKKDEPVSFFGIPLLFREHILGAIFVICSDPKPLSFSSEDIAFLTSIANPLALTIENAKLFDDIKKSQQQLRGLSQQLVDLQEEQIKYMARELHDGVGQNLSAININLSLLQQLSENYPEGVKSRLADTRQILEETVVRTRNLMSDFLPPMLERYGLSPTLTWFGEQFTKRTNIPVHINDNSLRILRLLPQVEISLFRIIQEALNNISKYAHAKQVEIELIDVDDHVLMTIADDGVGFDTNVVFAEQSSYWGLAIMRERARALDASFDIESAPGKGTKIHLRIAR